jgi:hypothetical protein
VWVPQIATELQVAERLMEEKNYKDALTAVREAQMHTEVLHEKFEAAMDEFKKEAGVS